MGVRETGGYALTQARRTIVAVMALGALWQPARVDAQQQSPRATAVRVHCTGCSPDSVRVLQLHLAEQFDSLRAEFEQLRLTDAERAGVARAMNVTLRQLSELMGDAGAVEIQATPLRRGVASGFSYRYRTADRGYLGVSFDGANVEDYRDGEHFVRFYQYPRVALVEPASPAERAGILPGDTLIALDGDDVLRHGEISLTKLLVPDRRLPVRVRRGGEHRTFVVTVGRAPGYVVRREVPYMVGSPDAQGRVTVITPDVYVEQRRGVAGVAPTPARRMALPWMAFSGVGGARVETVGEGLGRALGVASGVLVLESPAGTPAHGWGLRDGDVIRRVGDTEIETVTQLRAVLLERPGRDVTVRIVRDGRQRELRVRW